MIERFVAGLDISSFESHYKVGDGLKGRAPKDIRMVLAVLIYAIYRRTYSARQIEHATEFQADFWFLTNGQRISHDKISDFINMHEDDVHHVFLETIYLAHQNALLDFNGLYQDGYLLKANASKKRSTTMQDLTIKERRISDRLDAIMHELKDTQSAPAQHQEASHLENKLAKLAALKEQLQSKISQRTAGKAPWKANAIASSTTINPTDPDSDIMKQKDDSYANSYLKVSSIDGKKGIIIASDVAGYDNEPHMSLPLFQQANENCSSINKEYNTVLADSNFTSAENCVAFENADAQLIGPTRNSQEQERLREQGTDAISFSYDENNNCVQCSMGAMLQERSRYFDKHKKTTILYFSNPAGL